METADIIRFVRERATSYGALRKSAPTAIALDAAADRLEQLAGVEPVAQPKHAPSKPPFVVWSPDGDTPPKVAHTTHKSAHRAAHLLADQHPGRSFYVMGRSGRVVVRQGAPE